MSHPPPWNDGGGVPRYSGPSVGGDPGSTRAGGVGHRPPPYQPPPEAGGTGTFVPPYRSPYAGPAPDGGPGRPSSPAPAEWWQRAVARLIDAGALLIPATVLGLIAGLLWAGTDALLGASSSSVERGFWIIYSITWFLLVGAYDAVCVTVWGRTLGKQVMRIRVAAIGGSGRPGEIPIAAVLARAAVFNVLYLFVWAHFVVQVLLSLAGLVFFCLWPLWDRPHRQGIHDKIARTVVLRAD
ncbi:putative RDD family membrane protein YckC [Spinactinospora alkalitolerans]|uniref:Putative RDD family membrane protein YckC n=1 Tax=Spinactinospora alkalitolerans TaxID=687207 RepID=A0A852TSV4_9ACTN|nr:RDD family protein [Spinactinospora alkalitolerans]NYE46605.1 putative RDD family membrane protein YckC [Spinactinospora alkalitolerans]